MENYIEIKRLEKDQFVRIEKLEQVSNVNTLSIGYWIIGRLFNEITVGHPILVERYIRNGEKVLGVMNTSPVKTIEPNGSNKLLIHTANSIYAVEFVSEEDTSGS